MKDELLNERLKRYEALLQENGINLNQATVNAEAESHRKSGHSEVPETVWQLPTASTVSELHSATFKPKLLRRPTGTKLVDK